MAERGATAGTSPEGTASAEADWAVQATDTIVRAVDTVRRKTTGPAITIARTVVYGLLAAVLGVAALVLVAIMGVRILDAYLPNDWVGERHTWVAHLIVGVVFLGSGAFAYSKRKPRSADPAR